MRVKCKSETRPPLRLVVHGEPAQHLPWELLYHVHPDLGFVAQHPWCVVTRRLRSTGELQPRLLPRPLRLLLCIAAPEDLDPERSRLDFEREEELLFTALDRPLARGEVEIDVAEDGVLATLLAHLEEQRYHAVILSMHGTPARNSQGAEEWGLLFEDAQTGYKAPVAGSDLVVQLDRLPRGHRPGLMILAAFQRALPIAPTRRDEGTTLNNLSLIYRARGDYDTALRYLEQSLTIQRDIGDKAGLVATLHNMGHIAWQADNGERAMTLWSEAFTIAMETQNAQGIFHTARTLGEVLASAEASAQARQLLHLAVEVGKAAGFPEVQEVEAVLRRLPPAEV